MIPYGRQDITQADINAVVETLRSDFLTQGPQVPRFEGAVVEYTGVGYALAVNSATSALHLACLALGLGPGDWLWTSPITFVASANCAKYCGAEVDFVDVDPNSYNMSVDALAHKLKDAEVAGKLPKVVIPVHFAGQPCDMPAIYALAQQYGFKIIEDASHAIGAIYNNCKVGACNHSDITVFSFHPVKIITTGEGGMALTNNIAYAEKMALLRSHGITRDPKQMTHEPDGPWYYQQIDLGYNYRMTDIQAALGVSQMLRLDEFVTRRKLIASRYDELLKNLPVITPWQDTNTRSAWHLYVMRLRLDQVKKTHKEIFKAIRSEGIGVNLHYIPVHLQPYYQKMGFGLGNFPAAESYYSDAISLPMYPSMSSDQQYKVVDVLGKVVGC